MNPQSSRSLAPLAKDGIVQVSQVAGVMAGTSNIKVRWKVSYVVRGGLVEESGESNSVFVG